MSDNPGIAHAGCFICGGTTFDQVTPAYRRCTACGHETLEATDAQAYIINDPLDADAVRRPSSLDRFQAAILEKFSAGRRRRQLVDIGSGSGKFLLHHGRGFARATGVEITPDAVNFSRNTLGLEIVGDIADIDSEIDVVTAWHSLEHFPPAPLLSLFDRMRTRVAADGCVIVSVPNAASFQYRIFRRHFAFFDVPSHLQQFTPDSLARLFAAHGFVLTAAAISWPYNAFGYTQALLNCVMPGHNYAYYRLKRGRPRASLARDLAVFALLPLAVPLGVLLSLIDAAFPARQGVLTCRFEKRP
ncbi:MAG: class I SAM-dependent methyltransferase [Opitutaceae bacterium]|nr:class I SAM-dependent methyltransferase [Opitutaceae bacterium]